MTTDRQSAGQTFQQRIEALAPEAAEIKNRRWIYVPYDRYTDRTGPLTEQPADATGIVIVESTAKALRRPYHKKKLAVLISNMRHFALEQADRGVSVLYHFSPESHGQALLKLQQARSCRRLRSCSRQSGSCGWTSTRQPARVCS